MKKIATIVLLLSMVFSVFGCSKKNSSSLLDEDRWNNINYDNDDNPKQRELEDEGYVDEDEVNDRVINPIKNLPNYPEFERIAQEIEPGVELMVSDMRKYDSNYDHVTVGQYWGYGTGWSIDYYDTVEDAKKGFAIDIEPLETDVYDELITGDLFYKDNGDNGYIIANLYCHGDGEFFDNGKYYYGGIYYCNDRILEVWFASDSPFKNSEMDFIDKVIKAYGLPAPRE